MIDSQEFHRVAAEAYANPRASRYVVTPLAEQPQPYPFRTDDGAVAAIAIQFSVDHLHDPNVRRVITIACTGDGLMLWCGDKFTQGDISELEAGMRIGAALSTVPAEEVERARTAMLNTYGSYRNRAPCHFWKAWHSHHGVCKHVAAVLQHIELCFDGGLDALLKQLQEDYQLMMRPPAGQPDTMRVDESQVLLTRVLLPTLPSDLDAEPSAHRQGRTATCCGSRMVEPVSPSGIVIKSFSTTFMGPWRCTS